VNADTEPFVEEARAVTGALLDPERRTRPEALYEGLRPWLYVGDVHEQAQQFAADVELVRAIGRHFPMIRLENGELAPLALNPSDSILPFQGRYVLEPPRLYARFDYWPEVVYELLSRWEEATPEGAAMVAVEEAEERFREGVADFLATRIASVANFFRRDSTRQRVPTVTLSLPRTKSSQTQVQTVGFTVTIGSSHGLRIHVSNSFRERWRYFGAPSSPVVSTLTGGIYRFAADGGPYSAITPDPGSFDVPYDTVSPMLLL